MLRRQVRVHAGLLGNARRGGTQVLLKRKAGVAQALQDLQVLGNRQELLDAGSDLGADALAAGDVFLACLHQCIDGKEALRQHLAHGLAHVADAQREQHAAQRLLLGSVQLVYDLGGDGGAHRDGVARGHALLGVGGCVGTARVQRGDGVDIQLVEVRDVMHQPGLDQLIDQLLAHAVNVHAAAADPVDQALLELRGAVKRHAAIGHLAVLVHHGASAGGALGRHVPLDRIGPAPIQHRTHYLGDHVARFMNDDGIAHTDVLAADLVDVVQRGAGDGGAGDGHRVELRHGGEHAGAANLDADLSQHGGLLFRRELERDGPARRAGGEA